MSFYIRFSYSQLSRLACQKKKKILDSVCRVAAIRRFAAVLCAAGDLDTRIETVRAMFRSSLNLCFIEFTCFILYVDYDDDDDDSYEAARPTLQAVPARAVKVTVFDSFILSDFFFFFFRCVFYFFC